MDHTPGSEGHAQRAEETATRTGEGSSHLQTRGDDAARASSGEGQGTSRGEGERRTSRHANGQGRGVVGDAGDTGGVEEARGGASERGWWCAPSTERARSHACAAAGKRPLKPESLPACTGEAGSRLQGTGKERGVRNKAENKLKKFGSKDKLRR